MMSSLQVHSIMALLEEPGAADAARLQALALLRALCHAGNDIAAQLIDAGVCCMPAVKGLAQASVSK